MIFHQHRAVRRAIIYSLCFVLSVTPSAAFAEKDGAASQGEAPAAQKKKTLADTLLENTVTAALSSGSLSDAVDNVKTTVSNYAKTQAAKAALSTVWGKNAASNFFDSGSIFKPGGAVDWNSVGVGASYYALMDALSGKSANETITNGVLGGLGDGSLGDLKPNLPGIGGGGGIGGGNGGIGGGDVSGDLSGGALGGTSMGGASSGGFSGAAGDMADGAIQAALPGIPVPNSKYATYKLDVQGVGKDITTAAVVMEPPNPLKKEPVKFIVTIMSMGNLADTASIVYTPIVQVREKTYDAVGQYTEEFEFDYAYQPPCTPKKHGCYYPPIVYGKGKVTVNLKVEGSVAFGAGENGTSIYSDGPLLNGGDLSQNNLGNVDLGNGYNQFTGGMGANGNDGGMNGSSAQGNGLKETLNSFNDNITNILSGNMQYPFGAMKDINSGFNNLSDSILKLVGLKNGDRGADGADGDYPPGSDEAILAAAKKLQTEETPGEVREANMANMKELLSVTSKYLSSQGIQPAQIPLLYDNGSAYTRGEKDASIKTKNYGAGGWDMNRLTQFMVIDNKGV